MEIKERQLDIIEAAGAILTRSGVSGLTIKNLAAEMKFSESALYRHFSAKEEIIIAMLQYLGSNMDKRLAEAVKGSNDPVIKFRMLFENQFNFFTQNKHFVVAVFSDCLMEESERINETILELMEIKRKHALPILTEGQKKGVFITSVSPDHMMHISIGSFRLLMFRWRASNFSFDVESQGRDLINSLISLFSLSEKN